jgi:hypothetical protein
MSLDEAALAAGLVRAVVTEAKQNPAKKAKKKNTKRCNQSRDECRNRVLAVPDSDPEALADFLKCCENCFVGDLLTCLLAEIEN